MADSTANSTASDTTPPNQMLDWKAKVPTGIGRPTVFGLLVIASFFAGFGVWAATAPLSGAAIATGVVQASGQNLNIEHLEGGIIAAINVSEGQAITKDQVILELDTTRLVAERDRVRNALLSSQIKFQRIIAERDGLSAPKFETETILSARIADMEEDLRQQTVEFENRFLRHSAELAVLAQRSQSIQDEIIGLQTQKTAEERKLEVTKAELADKEALLKKGLTSRSQVNDLQRAEADSLGRIGSITATIAQRKTAIAENEEQRATAIAGRRETAASEINELRTQMADLREQLLQREDILTRAVIRSPSDGVIVKIAKNTVGSVVRPGEPVVELLPTGNELIVDARVQPSDIDQVKIGQPATLRLTALNNRTTPEVDGTVSYVSADRFVDEATREPYYVARLAMAKELPAGLKREQIFPGMPVDALIRTSDRTFVEYLIRPIQDSFAKAFREE